MGEYFYRSERRNGQPRRVYLGSGELGKIAADWAALEALQARHGRNVAKSLRASHDAILRAADSEAERAVKPVLEAAEAVLSALGHHRHARGQWRQRRGVQVIDQANIDDMTEKQARAAGMLAEWRQSLTRRAVNDEDVKAASMLRRSFQGDDAEYLKAVGTDLADAIRHTIVTEEFRNDPPVVRDIAAADSRKTKADLAGDEPSPIVLLLAEAAAIARLDWLSTMRPSGASGSTDRIEKRRSKAHARYLRTLAALAKVKAVVEEPSVATVVNFIGQQAVIGGSLDPASASIPQVPPTTAILDRSGVHRADDDSGLTANRPSPRLRKRISSVR